MGASRTMGQEGRSWGLRGRASLLNAESRSTVHVRVAEVASRMSVLPEQNKPARRRCREDQRLRRLGEAELGLTQGDSRGSLAPPPAPPLLKAEQSETIGRVGGASGSARCLPALS